MGALRLYREEGLNLRLKRRLGGGLAHVPQLHEIDEFHVCFSLPNFAASRKTSGAAKMTMITRST